jgi:hypothetical protein
MSYYNINKQAIRVFGLNFFLFFLKKIFYNIAVILLLIAVIKIFVFKFDTNKIMGNYPYLNELSYINLSLFIIFVIVICIWLSFRNEIDILKKIENNFIFRIEKNFKLKNKYRMDSILYRKITAANADLILIIFLSFFLMTKSFYIFCIIGVLFCINFIFQITSINKNYPITNSINKLSIRYEDSIFELPFINKSKRLLNRLEKIRYTKFISEVFLICAIVLIIFLSHHYKLENSFIIELIILIRYLYGSLKSFFSNTFLMSDMYKSKKNLDYEL